MIAATLAAVVGGVGLFLLGMHLMTDGLKLAAGRSLTGILTRWTGGRLRGLLSGFVITGVVQSSSAVTVATVGFVNAGLLTLTQAMLVIYGSNVGTTVTGWLVAILGFKVDLKAFALPLVGVGMLTYLVGGTRRIGAVGQALAGFGVFFLGVQVLADAFVGLGDRVQLDSAGASGVGGLLLATGVGLVLTILMQSSSAALAIVLSAVGGGTIPVDVGAAAVIGANVGTTSTAILSVIGATPNARRVALGHTIFNGATGVVALLLLPFILQLLDWLQARLELETGAAALVAGFHTGFNLLGVVLLLPLTGRLVRFLEGRFRTTEEDESRPLHLDRSVVATPSLSLHALSLELARVAGIARRMALAATRGESPPSRGVAGDRRAVDRLVDAIGEYAGLIQRGHLPPELDAVLPDALRVSRYYSEMAELAEGIVTARAGLVRVAEPDLGAEVAGFQGAVARQIQAADPLAEGFSARDVAMSLEHVKERYQRLKAQLLRAGSDGRVAVRPTVDLLDVLADIRRLAEQATKASGYLDGLFAATAPGSALADEDEDEAAAQPDATAA